jgi:protein gp37
MTANAAHFGRMNEGDTIPSFHFCRSHRVSERSTIEWTQATWNPVRGCEKISPGCAHCYAETFAERFRGVPGHPYERGFDLRLAADHLIDPLTWLRPRYVFTASMSDVFHKDLPVDYLADVFRVMRLADWHVFQVLTKRSERMRDLLNGPLAWALDLPNVWWGVTVDDRRFGLPRVEHPRAVNATVRWLSVEPLLEDLGEVNLTGIGWVVVGGESGHGARPMHPDWARSLRDQCKRAGVPFFFKQHGTASRHRDDRALDGVVHSEFPVTASVPPPPLRSEGDGSPRRSSWRRGGRDLRWATPFAPRREIG